MKLLAGLVLGLAMVSPGWAFDDPKALIDAIYTPYTTLGVAQDQNPAQFYSERLKGLVAANAVVA